METRALRQALLTRLGDFPRRTALAPIMEAPINEGEYSRARLTYEVEEGERIAAWLLIPKGLVPQGGWPALLALHQHAGQFALGKSEPAGLAGDPMYAYGRDLCREDTWCCVLTSCVLRNGDLPRRFIKRGEDWMERRMNVSSLPGGF